MITEQTLAAIVAAGEEMKAADIKLDYIDGINTWHVVEMAKEIQRLRVENDELRHVVEHPPSVERFIDNLADSLVSASDEIDRLRKQLSGNTGDVTSQQEALKEGRWA